MAEFASRAIRVRMRRVLVRPDLAGMFASSENKLGIDRVFAFWRPFPVRFFVR
jgi:hypothetical protein